MREPVTVDGTAAVAIGAVGELLLHLPTVAFATAGPRSGAPGPRLRLSSQASMANFSWEMLLESGTANLPIHLQMRGGEEMLEGGWAAELGEGSGVWGFTWPFTDSERSRLSSARIDLAIWVNARHCYRTTERFVQALIEVRRVVGPSAILWAPRIGTPSNLAMLHYLGIDLLDTTEGMVLAGQGQWLYPEFSIEEPKPVPSNCTCEVCRSPEETERPQGLPAIQERALHAEHQYAEEEARVGFFLRQGRLRELVEARTVSQPALGEMLRWYDGEATRYSEHHASVVGEGVRPYVVTEAYRRPEVEKFRSRFLAQYRPPRSKNVLVLVPCAYTKPYRNSPTHRGFARALESARTPHTVHTVSVTSPLGVVPQELEHAYPARNYDIPVTGSWNSDERGWVTEAVRRLLQGSQYERILVHLPQSEYGWLKEILPPSETCQWTGEGESCSSKPALANLARAAADLPQGKATPFENRREESIAAVAFQFSPGIADSLFAGDTTLRGPPWFSRLTEGKGDVLATWKETRGTWHLTVAGGEKIRSVAEAFSVSVNPDVVLKGDLFAPGVGSAGEEVRIGSEVLLVSGSKLVGVGEATVPGEWMGRLRRGLVVKVRKHGGNV
ncbi:MAG: DUF5591 domain-containing protein [Candidatus Thermoplasmatota archaeon]|nr:DUF5591 domain-containing protein [Candidatus Thermoplasmatota archaeon]MCL5984751.1 DUF5591 domain-containing protein [Candidatus Thermoplasmatota archaeon]